MKLDKSAVEAALASGGDANERMPGSTDTPLLYIARAGHYKYPPAEIPLALVKGGADMEAKDASGKTALEVCGWGRGSEGGRGVGRGMGGCSIGRQHVPQRLYALWRCGHKHTGAHKRCCWSLHACACACAC